MLYIIFSCIIVVLLVIIAVIFIQYRKEINDKCNTQSEYNKKIASLNSQYDMRKQNIEQDINHLQKRLNEEHLSKINELTNNYALKQKELDKSYTDEETRIVEEIKKIRDSLTYYEELQNSVIENFKQQEQVRLQRDFYKINLTISEQHDIVKLRTVASEISKPVVLYKLIYEIYYKSKFDELFKRLVGSEDCGGIYKITNIKNEKVYIGRTTNFITRWRDHIKCGVGADSGAQIRTRLYEAMKEYGCENFTFEVLDMCDKDSQPEREKYWINFYKSTEFGYNVQQGG